MWPKLFRPDVLFLIGALQAIIPSLLLVGTGVNAGYRSGVLYGPVIIWVLGYISFWAGTRLVRRGKPHTRYPAIPLSLGVIKLGLVMLSLVCLIEIYGATKVYGGIPLLAFASGQMDASDTNLLETQSGFGQLGALTLTVSLLTALVFILIMKARRAGVSAVPWIGSALLIDIFATMINGKRQGMLMTVMFIVCCSTVAFGSPSAAIESFLPWNPGRKTKLIFGAAVCVFVLNAISGLAAIRSLGAMNFSAVDNLLLYYGFPVMNMEEQCRVADGLGPMEFKPLGIVKTLLPAKSIDRDSTLLGADPPRIEVTSPSGFYERIQWDTGPFGIVLFSLCCGAFCQTVYYRAFLGYGSLLAYGLIAWALFSAPLYNHFLNLLYFPLPALIFWGVSGSARLYMEVFNAKQHPMQDVQ
jgi:oligosaccharide repeat unit polymerase